MKSKERENYKYLEIYYVQELQHIKQQFAFEVEDLYEMTSDLSWDLIAIKREKDLFSMKYLE